MRKVDEVVAKWVMLEARLMARDLVERDRLRCRILHFECIILTWPTPPIPGIADVRRAMQR